MADEQTTQPTETIDSFAQKIKAKYPDYAQMDNRELANKIVTKYPEYKASIRPEEFSGGQTGSADAPQKTWMQKVRDVMPEGLIRRGLEKGSEWAAGKQQESYDADLKRAAQTGEERAMPSYSPGTGYGMLSSLMRYAGSAIQPTPKETAIGAATIAAPEIAGPALVAHGMWNAAKNTPEALKGNPEAAEGALLGGAEAAGGGAATGGAIAGGLKNTVTGKLMKASYRTVIKGEPLRAPEAPKALTQAIQPGVNIPRAQESIAIAGPRLQQVRQANDLDFRQTGDVPATKNLLDGIKIAKEQVHQAIEQRLGPVADLSPDTSSVADAMEESISGRTERQFKSTANAVRDRAATYRGTLSLREIENSIQDANNSLRNFYKRPGSTDSPTSADMDATLAEVKALRSLLDEKVESLSGEGVKDLKREYGALRDVERATARQHAVSTRTKEGGLWEGLAYLHAAGDLVSGNALGAFRGAASLLVGRMLRTMRDPNYLIEQSFHGPKAFNAAEPISPHGGPPEPKGLLPKPPTEAGFTQEDASGTVRGGRYTTPKAQIPAEREPETIPAQFLRVIMKGQKRSPLGLLRENNAPATDVPPMVDEQFARETTGTVSDPNRLGARGQGGVRTTPKGELPSMAGHYERARLLVQQTLDMLRSGDRPGRYYDQNEMGEYNSQNAQTRDKSLTSGGQWRGVKSMRNMLPWLNETEFTPQELERALRMAEKGKAGPVLNSALEYVKREGKTPREPGEEAPF